MALLQLESVSASYPKGDQDVLSNVSAMINDGEVIAILGPNGAGKTTLLNIIAGRHSPDSGLVQFDGKVLEGPEAKLIPGHEEIRLVYQDYGLKPGMTVYENIRYQLLDFKEDYQQERIEFLLDLFRLSSLANRKPSRLSGGQQQKVAMANAMATDPRILLMDEPFSNVDPGTKQELFEEVRRISRATNTAILLVTHDGADALALSDKIMFLREGKLEQYDTTSNCYYQPESFHVANFLGPMVEVPKDLLSILGIRAQEAKKTWIRPEKIKLSQDRGLCMKVIDQKWRGFYKIYALAHPGGAEIKWYGIHGDHEEGEEVCITLNNEDLLYF